MTAVRLFAGLTSSDCALAIAAASWAMVSLEARIGASIRDHVEADRAGFGALGADAMAESLACIFRHQKLQLGFCCLMLSVGLAGASKNGSALAPSVGGAHINDSDNRALGL